MDVDAAGRPESGPDAGEHATPVGADDRLRTVVLVVAVLAVLVGGGWWWQAEAPRTGPVAATPSPAAEAGARPDAPSEARTQVLVSEGPGGTTSVWIVDPATGAVDPGSGVTFEATPGGGLAFRVDPGSGEAVRGDVGPGGPDDPRRLLAERLDGAARHGRLESFPGTVWTARAVLSPTESLVRHASAEGGARHLLQYRCVGAGELLVVIARARAAAPVRSVCDGSVHSTGVTARGGPFQITLASANAGSLRVSAQLVALP
ncbi:hypothetical protein AB0D32_28845 [Micromonospora sp. NPDC048170]|uniref:hypothetical protein n=1 Tax=Micromonospora sp. NPDC048170 TaxID=3154819 RepID=UPI003405B3B6